MQKSIKEFTTVELKALVYDLVEEIKNKEQAITLINQEIAGRATKQNEESNKNEKEGVREGTQTPSKSAKEGEEKGVEEGSKETK